MEGAEFQDIPEVRLDAAGPAVSAAQVAEDEPQCAAVADGAGRQLQGQGAVARLQAELLEEGVEFVAEESAAAADAAGGRPAASVQVAEGRQGGVAG